MIDISELRIFNLVKVKTSNDAAYYPVYAIDGMGMKIVLGGVRQCEGWKDMGLLKPIPLTEKLLLKSGFKECSEKEMLYSYEPSIFKLNNVYVKNNLRKGDEQFQLYHIGRDNWNNEELVNIKYLHQLQNIYYDFTGKEMFIDINK